MRAWVHYETVTTVDGQTVIRDYGYLDSDGFRWSMDGAYGEDADTVKTRATHYFPITSVDDFDAIVDWIREKAGHVDIRYEDIPDVPVTQTVTVTLAVTDAKPYDVSAITIQGTRGQVLAVMRLVELASAPHETDLTEAYGGGYLL